MDIRCRTTGDPRRRPGRGDSGAVRGSLLQGRGVDLLDDLRELPGGDGLHRVALDGAALLLLGDDLDEESVRPVSDRGEAGPRDQIRLAGSVGRIDENREDGEPPGGLDYIAVARQASLGIMAVCALLVLRMFRGAKKKVKLEAAAEQLPGAEGAAALLPGETRGSPLALRRQIAGALERDPDRVKQLFASWIEEKGD